MPEQGQPARSPSKEQIPTGRVTIYTVAAHAGVSPTAVSLAMKESSEIAPATRQRIQETAAALGYQPRKAASRLSNQRSRILGVMAENVYSSLNIALVHAVQVKALAAGFEVVVILEALAEDSGRRAVAWLQSGRADGMILNYPAASSVAYELARLGGRYPPIAVLCDNRTGAERMEADCVQLDLTPAAQLAITHLARLGHRRVAYLHPADRLKAQGRLAGYRQACEACGLDRDPALTHYVDLRPGAGHAAIAQLMALPEPPTAVFCCTDPLAIECIAAALAQGFRVPEDLAVIGVGNSSFVTYSQVPLSTIDCQPARLGEEGQRLLIRRLEDPDAPKIITELTPRLVIRDSCGGRGLDLTDTTNPAPG